MSTVAGVIPARLASTRLKGKVLLPIHGAPMIHHVYTRAQQCKNLDSLIIATDAVEVLEVCRTYGDAVVMTSSEHQSGTDRVAEVASTLNADIVVNIQGDEPELDPDLVDSLVDFMLDHPELPMGTVGSTALNDDDLENSAIVKVVGKGGRAVGFYRQRPSAIEQMKVLRHIGLYAYRSDFLQEFTQLARTGGELEHKLEQLRALESGIHIGLVETDYQAVAVDTADDLEHVIENWCGEGIAIDEKT
ncbi:3-deoxy-manno-octulosonate cytidylyltransferase [Candidatus Neomarinimicrobiota bacterium]